MAIRNNLLGGTDWGEEGLKPTVDLNQTINAIIEFAAKGQSQIPFTTLKATGNWVNEGNLAADRTTDSNGINNTINTGSTTAEFETNKYILGNTLSALTGTTYDPNSFSNPSNAFDGDDATYAEYYDFTGDSATVYLGKTFTSQQVDIVRIIGDLAISGGSGNYNIDFYVTLES